LVIRKNCNELPTANIKLQKIQKATSSATYPYYNTVGGELQENTSGKTKNHAIWEPRKPEWQFIWETVTISL